MSLATLARAIGVDRSTIAHWEMGNHYPRHDTYQKLCAIFGVGTFEEDHSHFLKKFHNVDPFIKALTLADETCKVRFAQLANDSQHFVHYTSLCPMSSRSEIYRPIELEDETFVEKLKCRKIRFQQVRIFYRQAEVELAMEDEFRFRGINYFCRYIPTPPVEFPVINMRSYDNRTFIIGGFQGVAADLDGHVLEFDGKEPVATFLKMYWETLWASAREFPTPRTWNAVDKVCDELRIERDTWQSVADAIRSGS